MQYAQNMRNGENLVTGAGNVKHSYVYMDISRAAIQISIQNPVACNAHIQPAHLI
jgi:hypothetical protein